jgi:hypothetical protein
VSLLAFLTAWFWLIGALVYALATRDRGHGVAGLVVAAVWPVAVPAELVARALVEALFSRVIP